MIMLFMLGWNKHYNVVDSILRIRYIYTFKHKNQKFISYRVQGWLLFVVFVIKIMRIILSMHTFINKKEKKKLKKNKQ